MSRIFGFVGILAVLAVGMYIYKQQIIATSAPGGATANPRAAVDVTGVKSDLVAIAQAERRYWATNGKYTSLDELISNGDISMQKPSRGPFNYSSDFSDSGFTITATNSSVAESKPKTISIVMSWPIARLLKTALRLHDNDLVFVGCYQYNKTDTMLPIKGHALRRTYRSVAAELGIDPVSTHLLMNHSMQGINAQYINQMMMSGAPGLRKTQARISARIIELLGIDSNARAPS